MKTLKNKVDFVVIMSVTNANPNGDPLNGNRPRTDYNGIGEMSHECLTRKMRNVLMDDGESIFVQSDDNRVDECRSLKARLDKELKKVDMKNDKKFREAVCEKWFDVRAFGQVFAYKKVKGNDTEGDENSISVGIRGPVSVHSAFSVCPVNITSTQITKSVNNEGDGTTKASDTMGMKHRVDHGVYVFKGAINTQLASKTGFSEKDAKAIKNTITHLFQNDASTARPEGSMEVHKVIWWDHNCPNGQYSSAKVHRSVKVFLRPDVTEPKSIENYEIVIEKLEGLTPEVIEGY